MTTKQKAVEHYERMIEWVKGLFKNKCPNEKCNGELKEIYYHEVGAYNVCTKCGDQWERY